jgi:hypothetical protein
MHEKTTNHGEIIHAAISRNPDYLVKGPKVELRCSDPRSNTDTKLLNYYCLQLLV